MTPPYWIDMSKLFELCVLGKLKKTFDSDLQYLVTTYGNELDFLLSKEVESIVDRLQI